MCVDVLTDVTYTPKGMSEEETRDLIARQRSALYKEGPFADKGGYVDENGVMRTGIPTHSGPASLRGASPLAYELGRNAPGNPDATSAPGVEGQIIAQEIGSRPNSTTSPQSNPTSGKAVFDNTIGGQQASRTSTSSPGGSPPRQDSAGNSRAGQGGASVAPIGTRPSGTPVTNSSSKRSTTPLASPGGWGRGGWPQASSGLGGQASVWA